MLNHIAVIFLLVALGGTLMIGNILGPAYAGVPGFWTAGAPMLDPRTGTGVEGAAASHISGKIYVSHGFRGGDSFLLSSYDIASDTWTHGGAGLPDAFTFTSELGGASENGKHYAIGGRAGPDNFVEEFDPVGATWASKTVMPTARATQHSVAEVAGKIYVIAGRTGATPFSGGVLSANEVYDVASDSWTPLAPIPTAVSDAVALAFNNKIYIFGGADNAGTVLSLVQIYDIASDTWNNGSPMPTTRGAHSGGLCGSNMHIVGGFDGTIVNSQSHEVYDPITDSWSADTPMPVGITEVQGVSVGNQIFFIGSGIFGLSGSDNQIWNCESKVIGGEFLPIDSTALVLAGLQTSAIWMLPVLAGVAGSAFGILYIKSRRN